MAKKKTPALDPELEAEAPAVPGPDADDGTDLQDHLQQLQFTAAQSYEKLSEAAGQLAEQARTVYETSQEYVRQNPVGYALGAFALGCLLGLLLGRD